MGDDERMLERLARALNPAPLQPSATEMRAFRRAVNRFRAGRSEDRIRHHEPTTSDRRVVTLPPAILRAPGRATALASPAFGLQRVTLAPLGRQTTDE
jgi:hypothetical protein